MIVTCCILHIFKQQLTIRDTLMDTKICSKCTEDKPMEAYPTSGASADGRMSKCRRCVSAIRKSRKSEPKGLRPPTRAHIRPPTRAYIRRTPVQTKAISPHPVFIKSCTKCLESKESTEFGKNSSRPTGLMDFCKPCKRSKDTKSYQHRSTNRDDNIKQYNSSRYLEKRTEILEYNAGVWANMSQAQKDRRNAQKRVHYSENKDKYTKWQKTWTVNNRDRVNAAGMKRYSAKKNRTVSWADDSKIAVFYREAQRLTDLTGIPHHVDHIIPLQGELVSGFHHEDNLQVLTQFENISKNNKYEVQ